MFANTMHGMNNIKFQSLR